MRVQSVNNNRARFAYRALEDDITNSRMRVIAVSQTRGDFDGEREGPRISTRASFLSPSEEQREGRSGTGLSALGPCHAKVPTLLKQWRVV